MKLIPRVSGFSGFKLAVVSANEAVITGKMLFIVVIFIVIMQLPISCGGMITHNHNEEHCCGYVFVRSTVGCQTRIKKEYDEV